MNTLERIRKEQQERYAIQREKDKAKIEAMFSNNPRPLNNAYLLAKEENQCDEGHTNTFATHPPNLPNLSDPHATLTT